MSQKLRNCCFTTYSIEEGRKLVPDQNIKYIIYQLEECPETLRPHLQGYVEFSKEIRFNTIKKKILPEGTHFEAREGTQAQAIAYCSKLESRLEPPVELGEKKEQGKRNDVIAFRDDIIQGASNLQLLEDYPDFIMRHPRFLDFCRKAIQPKRDWITKVIVLYGPSGCGKTRYVYEKHTIDEVDKVVAKGNFILSYTNKKIVLIDDFEPTMMSRSDFLQLTDRYPHTVNVKNGEAEWNPETIYITTNFDPQTWYTQPEAVLRRISEFKNFYD